MSVLGVIGKVKPDEIYNLAAQSHVQVSFDSPEFTADVDAVGVLRILEAVRQLGMTDTCRIYQASTSELYGKVEEVPQNEMRKIYLAKLLHEADWQKIRRDLTIRPVGANIKENGEQVRYVIDGNSEEALIRKILAWYGIEDNIVTLWGTGTPLREFLWSEDMADASVHVLLNVDFSDIIGIEKYSSVHYGVAADGVVDRNHSTGRGGYIPSLGEIRNCHINVGTGKELTIRELSELVVKAVGFEGEVAFDSSKPDGTMRKLIDVEKLHSLGWTHSVEIEQGVQKLFDWYKESLEA